MNARPILIIEDEHALGSALELLIRRMGHLPTLAASGKAGLENLSKREFDAMVLDIGLPDMSGLKVLESLRQTHADVPVLVITAHATLRHAIDSQKSGATAYLTKPLDMKQFQQTLDALLVPTMELREKSEAEPDSGPDSPTLIGGAPCLKDTFLGIARACSCDFPVLITGPTGSGKTLAASVIHAQGRQAGRELREYECARLKDASVFEDTGNGSLVLDEITALTDELQAALAASLSATGGIGPRVMATTVEDPLQAVRDGRLREDLYYVLCPLTIPLPPLAERSGDIPALCAFFAGLRETTAPQAITPPVMVALQAYDWPGNVRELKHVIAYALSMSQSGPIFLSHLPQHVADLGAGEGAGINPGSELEAVLKRWLDLELSCPEEMLPSYDDLLQKLETRMLEYLMERYENRPTHLAGALKLHRGTLRQKLQRAGLPRKAD